jgi:hypothetical protein
MKKIKKNRVAEPVAKYKQEEIKNQKKEKLEWKDLRKHIKDNYPTAYKFIYEKRFSDKDS